MCIGIPMQVVAVEPGHAQCVGRDGLRRVRTALVGAVQPGDWLLIFIDSAQEVIDAQRAAEIDATLDLLQSALGGDTADGAAPAFAAFAAFDLPSRWTADELRALAGESIATPTSTLTESHP